MSQLVVAVAGAAVGFAIGGPVGAQWGWMAGTLAGSLAYPPHSEGPHLGDLSVTSSAYGAVIPYLAGHQRIGGQVIWASSKRELATTTTQGGKGGAESTTYTYECDIHILLTENMIAGVTRVWSNGKLVWTKREGATEGSFQASEDSTRWSRITTYTGAADQMPDPDGHPNAPAYRGRGGVFIKNLGLGSSGSIPNLTFEVTGLGRPSQSLFMDDNYYFTEVDAATGATVSKLAGTDGLGNIKTYAWAIEYVPATQHFWVSGNENTEIPPGFGTGRPILQKINASTRAIEFTHVFTEQDPSEIFYSASHGDSIYFQPVSPLRFIYKVTSSTNTVEPWIDLNLPSVLTGLGNGPIEVSPDGAILCCSIFYTSGGLYHTRIRFFNATTGSYIGDTVIWDGASPGQNDNGVDSLCFSHDGSKLYATGRKLYIIDVSTRAVLHTVVTGYEDGYFGGLQLSHDGSILYTGYYSQQLDERSPVDGSILNSYTYPDVLAEGDVTVSPDMINFSISSDGSVVYITDTIHWVMVAYDTAARAALPSFHRVLRII